MKKRTQHLIAEVPRKRGQVELTIGIDLGDVWSHYCTLNQQGEGDRPRSFQDDAEGDQHVVHTMCLMLASRWRLVFIRSGSCEQLEQLGHEVIVANVRELRAISPQRP